MALGEPVVRSAVGEPLDASFPVTLAPGESMSPSCFSLVRDAGAPVPQLTAAVLSIERSAGSARLRIRSQAAVQDPAVSLSVRASCAGLAADYRRDFALTLDPRGKAQPAAARAPVTPMAIAATLIARIGDTLESIARAIFPDSRPARESYIVAMREANPALASLGAREPIPLDTPIALPDLRTFAQRHAAKRTELASAERSESHAAAAPTPRIEHAPRRAPKAEAPRRSQAKATPPHLAERRPVAVSAAPAPPPTRTRASGTFQLKLSSGEVDLSPTRGMDERKRAALRERQMVLDVDDQVAAVLELRHNVKQLQSQVAELQLKLAAMPSTFPAPKPAPPKVETPAAPPPPAMAQPSPVAPAPKIEAAPKAEPPSAPKIEAPTPAPKIEATAPAPKVETTSPAPKPEPPAITPPQQAMPGAKIEPAPPKAEPLPAPKVAAPAAPKEPAAAPKTAPATSPAPTPSSTSFVETISDDGWLRYGLWFVAFALLALAIAIAVRLVRRGRVDTDAEEDELPAAPEDEPIVVADEVAPAAAVPASAAPEPLPEDAGRVIASDSELATRLPDRDVDATRRRYIEERFPEVASGAIVLDDPASVVKAARLFYEDGALPRAVELLQLAIDRKPEEVKTWLALFEIFRLERLSGEYAELARRFREQHGKSDYWRKVQFFGREIEPGNKLFQDERIASLETIGPSEARRIAADANVDPITENWLNAPMDFQNEVLANELRRGLMAHAGLNENDLVANPMPALRNIEMFTVA